MNDPMLSLEQIEVILEEALAWDRPGQLAAYASIMLLLRELREYVETLDSIDTGYAAGKAVEAKWHVGAAFGLDADNGLPVQQHRGGAMGAIRTLKEILRRPV